MSNYIKKILFTILIIVIPYMNSASKAMDVEDYERSSVRARNVGFVAENLQEVQSFSNLSTSSNVKSFEDSKNSWASYLYSPAKSFIQKTYEVIDFTTRNPSRAIIIGGFLALQVTTAAAACYDICTASGACNCVYSGKPNGPYFVAPNAGNQFMCNVYCDYLGFNSSRWDNCSRNCKWTCL